MARCFKFTSVKPSSRLFLSSILAVMVTLTLLLSAIPGFANTEISVLPTALNFNPQASGSVSAPQTITIFNLGTTTVTVVSVTSPLNQFVVSGGSGTKLSPGQSVNFTVTFEPTLPKTFKTTLTVTLSGTKAQTVPVGGTGTSLTAVASLNTKTLTFASQALGTTSAAQAVTITNTGTTAFHVTGVTVTYPFTQTGFSGLSTIVSPKKSLTMNISFFPTALGLTNGTLWITYDSLASAGVSLSGTGEAAAELSVSTFPTLPSGTQKSAYQADLAATAGVPPYSWSLASGSTLPSGLSLSSAGIISGTLASTVNVGSYNFTAKVTDSNSPPSVANATLTMPVFATPGSVCNNISVNAADDSGPLIPINDLGTGYYLNAEQGGLYPGGSNVRPAAHDASGVSIAQGIGPLDAAGNPSSTGKYVFLSVGESIAQQPFEEFIDLAQVDPSLNSNMVVVDGATGGATAAQLANSKDYFWSVVTNDYLPNAGVTAKQVVVAWFNSVNGGPSGTFPTDMTQMQANYESVAQNLLLLFPNIKMAYFSSINYTGYSDGLQNLSNEPYSYEAGFAVKNAIQDQINGNANLNFNPANGPVLAPWIDWGPYYWANGMLPRSDGLVWTCQDLTSDGTHPSDPVGRLKVSTQLMNYLKSDDTASIWFLAPGAK
jgi:hypothetical protein